MKKNRSFSEKFKNKQDISILYNVIDFNNLNIASQWSYTTNNVVPFENAISQSSQITCQYDLNDPKSPCTAS